MLSSSSKVLCTGGSGFIGTHLIDRFLDSGVDFVNIDIVEPKKETHFGYWRNCNILDVEYLESIFKEYKPTHVVHLAARATTSGKSMDDYLDNTDGTANVLKATNNTLSINRIIITSSQHVRKPGSGLPQHDQDFNPHGLYGQSKVITEQLTRQANLNCIWTIIRPTTVWGPYHPYLPAGLWNLMKKGLYVHPKKDSVVRSYSYVKNVVWAIQKILEAPKNMVNQRVLYLGDELMKQRDWIDAFSMALVGRKTTKVPKQWIYLLSRFGDLLETINIRFPMDSARYFNLTTTNPVPLEPVIEAFGFPPYSLEEGYRETIMWLKENG